MRKNRLQVRALVRRSALQVASARFELNIAREHLVLIGLLRAIFVVVTDKVPLDVINGQCLTLTLDAIKKYLERANGAQSRMPLTAHAESVAAACNLHTDDRFYLAQILVERTTQVTEIRIVRVRAEAEELRRLRRRSLRIRFVFFRHVQHRQMNFTR